MENDEPKYKHALERARDLITKQNPPAFDKDLIFLLFPELKKEEYEKMKFLIKSCVYASNITPEGREEIFAWLEKQGEQSIEPKWCHHKVDLSDCTEEYRKAYYDGWNNCNMQHSQCKAENNDEDERIRKAIISGMSTLKDNQKKKTFAGISIDDCIDWLERQGKETSWKPTYEQMTELNHLISGCSYEIEIIKELQKQLESLKK